MPGKNKERKRSSTTSMTMMNKRHCQQSEDSPAAGDIHNDVTLIINTSTPENTVQTTSPLKNHSNKKKKSLFDTLVLTARMFLQNSETSDSSDESDSCSCSNCESSDSSISDSSLISSSFNSSSSTSSSSLETSATSSSSASTDDENVFSTEYTLSSDDDFY